MMGGEIEHQLQQDGATQNIPVILLSGLNTKEDEQIAKEKAGSYHLLAKPVTAEELLESITKVLSE